MAQLHRRLLTSGTEAGHYRLLLLCRSAVDIPLLSFSACKHHQSGNSSRLQELESVGKT